MGFSLSSLPNPHQQAFGMQLDQVENDPPQPREGSSSRPDNGSEWRRKEASKQLLKPNPQLLRLSPQLCLTLPGTIPSRRGGNVGLWFSYSTLTSRPASSGTHTSSVSDA